MNENLKTQEQEFKAHCKEEMARLKGQIEELREQTQTEDSGDQVRVVGRGIQGKRGGVKVCQTQEQEFKAHCKEEMARLKGQIEELREQTQTEDSGDQVRGRGGGCKAKSKFRVPYFAQLHAIALHLASLSANVNVRVNVNLRISIFLYFSCPLTLFFIQIKSLTPKAHSSCSSSDCGTFQIGK